MWGPPSRDRLAYELYATEEQIRAISFKIMELKRYRAFIIGKPFLTDSDRQEIARIEARIAELEFMKEELIRRANYLRRELCRF
jgi:hypothetical protein